MLGYELMTDAGMVNILDYEGNGSFPPWHDYEHMRISSQSFFKQEGSRIFTGNV